MKKNIFEFVIIVCLLAIFSLLLVLFFVGIKKDINSNNNEVQNISTTNKTKNTNNTKNNVTNTLANNTITNTTNFNTFLLDDIGNMSDTGESKKENDNVIIVNNDNYLEIYNDLKNNVDKYLGWTIISEGFVYRQSDMKKNEFFVGRYLMTCCAYDMSVISLKYKYSKYYEIKNENWYRIEAVVEKQTVGNRYSGKKDEPLLKVTNIVQITEPTDAIIYDIQNQ